MSRGGMWRSVGGHRLIDWLRGSSPDDITGQSTFFQGQSGDVLARDSESMFLVTILWGDSRNCEFKALNLCEGMSKQVRDDVFHFQLPP